MTTSPGAIVAFLADCYREENRTGGVADVLADQVAPRAFWPGEELLLSGLAERLAVPAVDPWLAAAKAVALAPREKSLVYFAFPLVGRARASWWKGGPLCAPLLLYPARLLAETADADTLALEVELDQPRLNASPLAALAGEANDDGAALTALLAELPAPPLGLADLAELASLLRRALPDLGLDELYGYPRLLDGDAVAAARRSVARSRGAGDTPARCLPACGIAVVPNAVATRGVLDELARLARTDTWSPPLRRLLTDPTSSVRNGNPTARGPKPRRTPRLGGAAAAHLSAAQQAALLAARHEDLSVVVGPPGTGKSHTLAAIALDHLVRGETVVLAARTAQAVDVLVARLEELLGGPAPLVRLGRGDALAAAKSRLEELLAGQLPPVEEPARTLATRLAAHERRLRRLEQRLLRRGDREQRLGERAGAPAGDGLGGWVADLLADFERWRLGREPTHWRLLADWDDQLAVIRHDLAALGRARLGERLRAAVYDHRTLLQTFLAALRARRSARQAALFERLDPATLRATFPLWATTFTDVHRGMPNLPALFDLAIVDEATQCDQATALPLLQRARRAVVTGDPRQLRHVSFLAGDRLAALAAARGLSTELAECFDYRGKSLLDRTLEATTRATQVAYLDEHFRSLPQLVGFANRTFYDGRLKVMTRTPAHLASRPLELRRVDGRRDPSGRNQAEATAVLCELRTWIEREASLPTDRCHTLGVLSPFREQTDLLAERIARELPLATCERHQLRVGTPYAFQGEERDVMLLSLAIDDDAAAATLRYLERPDVFNVSITRARARMIVWCSLGRTGAAPGNGEPTIGAGNGLLRRFLEAATAGGEEPAQDVGIARAMAAEVATVASDLTARGYRVWPHFVVAGQAVDLVIQAGQHSIGIDLVGFPGPLAPPFPLDRYRSLARAGLTVVPLPRSAWEANREACLAAICARLEATSLAAESLNAERPPPAS